VDRYAAAELRVSWSGNSEPEDIEAVQCSLDQYFSVASTTVQLLTQEWTAISTTERESIKWKAEERTADNAGPKMIQVSLALDRLLETVTDVAKDMRDEGTKAIQCTSLLLVADSSFIAFLNLFLTKQRGGTSPQTNGSDEPEINPRDNPISPPLAGDTPCPALRPE
jgi:hypothetical protein